MRSSPMTASPSWTSTRRAQLGGTGRAFDWAIAAEAAERYELLLAGGLTPDNVGRAIDVVSPWGVDVSSGIETDGAKDPRKIARFAQAIRRADEGSGQGERN